MLPAAGQPGKATKPPSTTAASSSVVKTSVSTLAHAVKPGISTPASSSSTAATGKPLEAAKKKLEKLDPTVVISSTQTCVCRHDCVDMREL